MRTIKTLTEAIELEEKHDNPNIFGLMRVYLDLLAKKVNWLIAKVGDEEEIWNEEVTTSGSQEKE